MSTQEIAKLDRLKEVLDDAVDFVDRSLDIQARCERRPSHQATNILLLLTISKHIRKISKVIALWFVILNSRLVSQAEHRQYLRPALKNVLRIYATLLMQALDENRPTLIEIENFNKLNAEA